MGFQYSLCRVVLMVDEDGLLTLFDKLLSVLALSSRFDGLGKQVINARRIQSFSTRSVESF